MPFWSQKVFIIPTWFGFVIYQFRVIPPVFALLYGNCRLTFKLNHTLPFSRGCHHWRCSVERDVLGGFTGFAGVLGGRGGRCWWCCSLYLIKMRPEGLRFCWGETSAWVFFLCNLWNFWEHLFWWASGNDSFWFSKFWHITRLVFIFSFFCNLYLFKLCYQSNFL